MRAEGGFSLVEVLVVALLVTVAILGVQATMVTAVASGRVAADLTSTSQLAAAKIEQLRVTDLAALTAGGSLVTDVVGYLETTDSDGDGDTDFNTRWEIVDLPVGKQLRVRVISAVAAQGAAKETTLRSFVGWQP